MAPRLSSRTRSEQQQSVTCWHCNKLVYRPRYLAWGKDLIPLHDGCVGAWIDAWDALLAEKKVRMSSDTRRGIQTENGPGNRPTHSGALSTEWQARLHSSWDAQRTGGAIVGDTS